MALFAYNLLLTLLSPMLLPYALWRGWRRGQPLRRLPERLGFHGRIPHSTAADSIWLHAVSLGEVLSCVPLIEELRRRFPASALYLSTATATGQEAASEKLAGTVDGIFYAPLDLLFCVRRVIRHLRPRLVVVAETEIWPNLFREAKRSGAGLLLVNGRISDQSQASYRRNRWFFGQILAIPDAILAQSAADRERFLAAGAPAERVSINGNFKYDFQPGAAELPAAVSDLLGRAQPRTLVVAGSTREDEEASVVEAFRFLARAFPRTLLVIAPRHPQRFEEVAALLGASGIPFLRRSALGHDTRIELPGILLLDSLGELAALYRAADVVFVGGSLNGWGGHNVLEPALYGRAAVVGPHMQNFRAIAEMLLSEGGLVEVAAAAELGPALLRLVENPEDARRIGERARLVAESQRGATQRAAEACEAVFQQAAPRPSNSLLKRITLRPPAVLWEAAARFKLFAYARGLFPRQRLKALTICVGNLTAGGAGKTPLVVWLVSQLHRNGHKAAVLTRGYGRSSSEQLILRPSEPMDPATCGDEPAVLLRHFAREAIHAAIGIGANRSEVGATLLSQGPAGERPDVLVLDDGFQHLALERDLDLLLVDVTDPFGGGEMLPLGRLREPLSSMRRAGAFLLTRAEPRRAYPELETRLRQSNPVAPIFRSSTRPLCVVDAVSGDELSLDSLRGRTVVAFCGLGNPESFWRALRLEGIKTVERIAFRDHHPYSQQDIQRIEQAASDHKVDLILTTEKDLVNLLRVSRKGPASPGEIDALAARMFHGASLGWLKIEAVVEEGDELLRWIEQRAGKIPPRRQEPVAHGAPV